MINRPFKNVKKHLVVAGEQTKEEAFKYYLGYDVVSIEE